MQNLHKSKLLGKHSDFWKCGFLSRGIYLFSSLPAFQFSGDTQTEKRFHGHSWQCTRLTFSWPWLSGPVRRQSVRLCPVMVGCEDVTWLHITQTLHAMGAGRQPAPSAWLRGGFSQGAGSKAPSLHPPQTQSATLEQSEEALGPNLFISLSGKEGPSSRAQSKLLRHQFLFSLLRQLKLRTVFKNYLIYIPGFKNNFS